MIGELKLCAFSRAPSGCYPCDGRELEINDYPMLFSVIGTTFGGDGASHFALPNKLSESGLHWFIECYADDYPTFD
jgi:microcystin-dependent protein